MAMMPPTVVVAATPAVMMTVPAVMTPAMTVTMC